MDKIIYKALQQAYKDLDAEREKNWVLETRLMNARIQYWQLDQLRIWIMKAYGKVKNKLNNLSDEELYRRGKK